MDADKLRWANKVKVDRCYKVITKDEAGKVSDKVVTDNRDVAMKSYNSLVKEGQMAKLILEEYSYELLAETDNWKP